jgi:hypothetical protein
MQRTRWMHQQTVVPACRASCFYARLLQTTTGTWCDEMSLIFEKGQALIRAFMVVKGGCE